MPPGSASPVAQRVPAGGPSTCSVLRLLATSLTQREIGEALYVSFNTVKTHVKSVFRKLDVGSRRDAVARARELRLL